MTERKVYYKKVKSDIYNYDVENLVVSKPTINKIKSGNTDIEYRRMNIYTTIENELTQLIFQTEQVFSFGVSENKNQSSGFVEGYSMALCMWDKNGPTPRQKAFTNKVDEISNKVKRELILLKKDLGKMGRELGSSDNMELSITSPLLKKINPLSWSYNKENYEIIEELGPKLYPKFIVSKRKDTKEVDKIFTKISDERTRQPIDPKELIGVKCLVRALVQFESVFAGSDKLILQIKLLEVAVKRMDSVGPSLLDWVDDTEYQDDENQAGY